MKRSRLHKIFANWEVIFFSPVIGNFCQLLPALRGKRHFETDIVKLSKLFEINYWNWKKQFQKDQKFPQSLAVNLKIGHR